MKDYAHGVFDPRCTESKTCTCSVKDESASTKLVPSQRTRHRFHRAKYLILSRMASLLVRLLFLWWSWGSLVCALPPTQQPAQSTQQQASSKSLLDISKLKRAIYSGRVYQQTSFLTEEQVQTLLSEISAFDIAVYHTPPGELCTFNEKEAAGEYVAEVKAGRMTEEEKLKALQEKF